jgi:hypothetical protein
MLPVSFRWFACRFVPGRYPRKQAVVAVALLFATGCGSGGSAVKERVVQGDGFTIAVPVNWKVSRARTALQASHGTALVSVTRYPLQKRFRPELWAQVVPELDRAAQGVARQQQGTISESRTLTVAGLKARRYDVGYSGDGKQLVERLVFVLRGRSEYLLLCRYERGGDSGVCDGLLTSFKLAAA